MIRAGDVILAKIQFADTFKIKKRPALVLFSEFDNLIVAGITSNVKMKGIRLSKEDGAIKNSVIKLNYIFTISAAMVDKVLFHLPRKTKKKVYSEMMLRLESLN